MTAIVQVDAFTAEPFAGNPAAVCVLDTPRAEAWMRNVAREMNLSETAFLHREGDLWRLRWFTPTAEVDLCGHATLASAHVLWTEGHLPGDQEARFHSASGLLMATREEDGWITLDFPANPAPPVEAPVEITSLLSLPTPPTYCGRTGHYLLLELEDEAAVRDLSPDFSALRRIGPDCPAIIVTARPTGEVEHDFVSRVFCPGVGIDEDPVTGAAHTVLGPHWAQRLGREELVGYQASARGGSVRVRPEGDRVLLGGQAVTVLRGELVD